MPETSEKGECGMTGLIGTSTELEGEVMGKISPHPITPFAPACLKINSNISEEIASDLGGGGNLRIKLCQVACDYSRLSSSLPVPKSSQRR